MYAQAADAAAGRNPVVYGTAATQLRTGVYDGSFRQHLDCLEAAVEAEGVYASDGEGQMPVFDPTHKRARFLPVCSYEEAIEKLQSSQV